MRRQMLTPTVRVPRALFYPLTRHAGLKNTTFIAGRAEDVLSAAIAQHAQQVHNTHAQPTIASVRVKLPHSGETHRRNRRPAPRRSAPKSDTGAEEVQRSRYSGLHFLQPRYGSSLLSRGLSCDIFFARSCVGRQHRSTLRAKFSKVPRNCTSPVMMDEAYYWLRSTCSSRQWPL